LTRIFRKFIRDVVQIHLSRRCLAQMIAKIETRFLLPIFIPAG